MTTDIPDGTPPAGAPAPPGPQAAVRLRRQRAWYWYDWANSGFFTTTSTVLFAPYLTVVAKRAACPGQDVDLDCDTPLRIAGIPVAAGSLALYTITAATVLCVLVLPIMGAVADRSARKRTLLARTAWAGAAAATAMVLVAGDDWQLGVLLQIVATICFAASLVVYDALLCEVAEPDERDRVSSRGWAFGYLGGGLLLAVNLALVTAHDAIGIGTDTAVRISLCGAGLWWAVFTLVFHRRLGAADAAIPATARAAAPGVPAAPATSLPNQLRASLGQLADTLRHARGYPQTLLFLLAYLLYNDGIQTVIFAATVFGQEELGLASEQLILTILVVQFVGVGGALAFGRLAGRTGARRALLAGIALWAVVLGAGYTLPEGRFAPFLALAVLIGLVLGGSQALSRSLFSQLVPRGREAEYFSLYQMAERGTSWLGTLLFGLTYQLSGSYRNAILALVAFFVLGGLLLARVDVRRGITEAGNEVPSVV